MEEAGGWISNGDRLLEVSAAALVFYVFVVALVRIMGKRTTSQMNNFDWIITIAVGSLAASGMLLKNVAILDALAAILVLAGMQWVTTWLVLRSTIAEKLVKAAPTLLVHRGKLLHGEMKKTRVSEAEICSVLREQGMVQMAQADWVILETDGKMTVIPASETTLANAGTMRNVGRPELI